MKSIKNISISIITQPLTIADESIQEADATRIAADDAFTLEVVTPGQKLQRTYARSRSLGGGVAPKTPSAIPFSKTPMRQLVPPPSAPTSASSQPAARERSAASLPCTSPDEPNSNDNEGPSESVSAEETQPMPPQEQEAERNFPAHAAFTPARPRDTQSKVIGGATRQEQRAAVLGSVEALRAEMRTLSAQMNQVQGALARLEAGMNARTSPTHAQRQVATAAVPLLQQALALIRSQETAE